MNWKNTHARYYRSTNNWCLLQIQQTANGDDDYNVKASAMTSGPDISDISPKPRSSMLTTGTSYIQ
jgi:hypothetical protein